MSTSQRLAVDNNIIDKLNDRITRTMNLIKEEEDSRSEGMSAAYISSKELRKALGYPKREDKEDDETNS